jgi:hypothetical protein
MAARTERQILTYLHRWGANRLRRVFFRANRSTIWSLTQGGSVLNLHAAFRTAPAEILAHFAVVAREAHRRTDAYRSSADVVRMWEGLDLEMRRIRREHRLRRPTSPRRHRRVHGPGPCCATSEQRVYLKRLYNYLNRTRFDGRLPSDIQVRLSNRMTTGIGQMVPGHDAGGRRYVVELALNVDLMLEGNGRERIDTLVHEMAHAADWLFGSGLGHGEGWRRWARYAGCRERACAEHPIRRRARGVSHVTRVPRLPWAARFRAA